MTPLRIPKPPRSHTAAVVEPPTATQVGEHAWIVESSTPDKSYRVECAEDRWSCECLAFTHRGTCKHIASARGDAR